MIGRKLENAVYGVKEMKQLLIGWENETHNFSRSVRYKRIMQSMQRNSTFCDVSNKK